jgi:hypothetical protein
MARHRRGIVLIKKNCSSFVSVMRTDEATLSRKWLTLMLFCSLAGAGRTSEGATPGKFQVEEATIAGIHAAITSGQATCKQVVQAYIDRAKADNGV